MTLIMKYFAISALCILQTMSHQCQWTNMRMKYKEIWQALDRMGGDLTNECLIADDHSFEMNFTVPKNLYRGSLPEGDAMKTIQETFHQMSEIFCKEPGAAFWDEARSDSLCINLHRVTKDLEACMIPMKKKEFTNHLRVKEYFRQIGDYLKDKSYERCAREMVKITIQMLLPDVRRLLMKLQRV